MNQSPEVELQNVTRRFGEVAAVDRISLQVKRSEFLTLLGPSGCGKTTLLRLIGGFEFPDEGRVILGGADVTDLPPFRRDVTTVFQHYALFPHLDVYDNVAFGLARKKLTSADIERRVGTALEMVRLDGFESRRPSELSGGQQQRVALARALILEPRVLLLDEPLAALDLKLRRQMQLELKGLQRRVEISFVYVTHDQEEALTMSDRIVVMNGGRVEQSGTAIEIYERPVSEFVAGFIGASNIIEGKVAAISDEQVTITVGGSRICVRATSREPGSTIKLMIRPEKIQLRNHGAENAIDGTITSAVYLGESTQWMIEIDGQVLTALEQNREPATASEHKVGEKVSVTWDPSSPVILEG